MCKVAAFFFLFVTSLLWGQQPHINALINNIGHPDRLIRQQAAVDIGREKDLKEEYFLRLLVIAASEYEYRKPHKKIKNPSSYSEKLVNARIEQMTQMIDEVTWNYSSSARSAKDALVYVGEELIEPLTQIKANPDMSPQIRKTAAALSEVIQYRPTKLKVDNQKHKPEIN